jgi:hypothetical protein
VERVIFQVPSASLVSVVTFVFSRTSTFRDRSCDSAVLGTEGGRLGPGRIVGVAEACSVRQQELAYDHTGKAS